jgi:hypothetical protein
VFELQRLLNRKNLPFAGYLKNTGKYSISSKR